MSKSNLTWRLLEVIVRANETIYATTTLKNTDDNCVRYRGRSLQIPPVKDRSHFVRAKVMVHEYEDGRMAVVHEGKRKLGVYDRAGNLIEKAEEIRKAVGE